MTDDQVDAMVAHLDLEHLTYGQAHDVALIVRRMLHHHDLEIVAQVRNMERRQREYNRAGW